MTRRGAARRYARALFDVALAEKQDLDEVARELEGMATLVAGNEALQRVLANPAVPALRKRAVVEQLLRLNPLGAILSKVLLLLAERDRLILLPDVAELYRSRLLDHKNVVRAEVRTAVPLSPERTSALQAELERATGRQVHLNVRVDPSLVGGAVARIGSIVYDASVVTQLEKLRHQLAGAEA